MIHFLENINNPNMVFIHYIMLKQEYLCLQDPQFLFNSKQSLGTCGNS
uniref:Uncharacterized protein n=1 Tax=Anguilla anguilla TaxID=7936 RepID=A0A0E9T9Q1_ANGAN